MVREKYSTMKKALITGITGQDGSYLAELLLSQGYEVYGLSRRNSGCEIEGNRLTHIKDKIKLYYGDMTDISSIHNAIINIMPDEIYNLAAMSDVRISFVQPSYTTSVNALAVVNLLETIRLVKPDTKIYQAGSSEMFGNSIDSDGYQRETTLMDPVSTYGCTKLFAHNICKSYRLSYNMFIINGILFNHESPRRGLNFVTNKVVKEAVKIKKGLSDTLLLGTLDARRDWGHSKDYVNAMWSMMQLSNPDDYVCATGITHSIKDLVEYVFDQLELDYIKYIRHDEKLYRPNEIWDLKGDSTKLKNKINWKPTYTFNSMLNEMIKYWEVQLT
jgi:GDPmannose 4,6-dehydratase